jgi:8-oxo-dGTP diphosphatase
MKDGKVLLVKRNKAPQKGMWAIPGGSVKLGETLQAAAEREIREETGLAVRALRAINTFDLIEQDARGDIAFHYVIIDLEADYVGGDIRAADDAGAAGWFGPDEVKDLEATPSTVQLLRKIGFLE